jgi:hypothetical protein
MRFRDCRAHPCARGNPRQFELNSQPVSVLARTCEITRARRVRSCYFGNMIQRAGMSGNLTLLATHLCRFLLLPRLCWSRRRFGNTRLSAVFATLILCAFQIVFLGHPDCPEEIVLRRKPRRLIPSSDAWPRRDLHASAITPQQGRGRAPSLYSTTPNSGRHG